MEVYNVEKAYVCKDAAVRTSSWWSDDYRHVEFFIISMLFTSLLLVLVAQYLISPSLRVDSNLVRKHNKSLVVHLLDPAIKRCLKGVLCSFGVQHRYGRLFSSSDISEPAELNKLALVLKMSSNDSVQGIYVELVLLLVFIPNSFNEVSI